MRLATGERATPVVAPSKLPGRADAAPRAGRGHHLASENQGGLEGQGDAVAAAIAAAASDPADADAAAAAGAAGDNGDNDDDVGRKEGGGNRTTRQGMVHWALSTSNMPISRSHRVPRPRRWRKRRQESMVSPNPVPSCTTRPAVR